MRAIPHFEVCRECHHCDVREFDIQQSWFCNSIGMTFSFTEGREGGLHVKVHPNNFVALDKMMRDDCPMYLENLVSE